MKQQNKSTQQARFSDCKHTLKLAAPLIAAQLAQMGMELVDTIMIGHIGVDALASAALSGVTYMTVLVFFLGILSALGVYIARHLGAENHSDVSHYLSQSFWLVGFISIPAMLIVWFIPQFFLLIGQDPLIVNLSSQYLHAVALGILPTLLFASMREFTSAMLHTQIVMWLSLSAIPLNAVLNYLFIYGMYGMPKMGIAGAGVATALINWVILFGGLTLYVLNRPELRGYFSRIDDRGVALSTQIALLKLGSPIGLTLSFEVGLFSITAMMMGYFGTSALAAHQVAIQCTSITFMFFFGLSQAVTIRLSRFMGARQPRDAAFCAYNGVTMAFIVSCFTALCFFALPYQIASCFFDIDDSSSLPVLKLVVTFLQIAAVFQFFDSFQVLMSGALRGLKDTVFPMLAGIFAYWGLGIGSGYYLGFIEGSWGPDGLWVGLCVGLGTSAVMLFFRFRQQINKTIRPI